MSKRIKHLIVDTTAFIKAENLQNISENIYTVQEVIDEITNDRQRRKLVVLPYDLRVKDVFTENINFVTEFSKKTGDYRSLSATDIKVMALTYQMEKELVGIDHLKSEPTMQRTVKVSGLRGYSSSEIKDDTKGISSEDMSHKSTAVRDGTLKNEDTDQEEEEFANQLAEQIKTLDLREEEEADNVMAKVDVNSETDEEESSEGDDNDDDDWITPGNLKEKTKELEHGDLEERNVDIACITSDFAMQNVLKQIGLNVTSIDGRIIRHLRTFIFRCTTCFKTTSVMTKLFCPKCGHATLKKVSVSVDENGNQHIHINGRKPLTARGKRFSLPTPKGGQHFQYPILTEDQHIHKRFATKLARKKTNALDPDYTAGFSPFAMNDVNSKSAVLGVRANKQDIKYWMTHFSKGKKK
ncbi:RNA-binding protein NOB1 isoform X1 [Leptidea sinapis]|uniref:RNA-binding protein NOB1 isoform X1 n=1 Tax=Leptidea sinapis TaxID=189913 RepID=UPI002129B508|nr:RNA-binding protein NOB1 isoform X1 [Leptidea sinapis]